MIRIVIVAILFSITPAVYANDMQDIQGVWRPLSMPPNAPAQGQDHFSNQLYSFSGDSFFITSLKNTFSVLDKNARARPPGGIVHKFRLDSAVNPKTFDLIPSDGPQKGKTVPWAIYDLSGDFLTLKWNLADDNERPKSFTFDPQQPHQTMRCVRLIIKTKNGQRLTEPMDVISSIPWVFTNQLGGEFDLPTRLRSAPTGTLDREKLQGLWQPVAKVASGKTVKKTELMKEQWLFVDDRLLVGSISTFFRLGPGSPVSDWQFKLSQKSSPGSIELTDGPFVKIPVFDQQAPALNLDGMGIYEWDKDTIKLCINFGTNNRPKDFRTGTIVVLLERILPGKDRPRISGNRLQGVTSVNESAITRWMSKARAYIKAGKEETAIPYLKQVIEQTSNEAVKNEASKLLMTIMK